MSDTTTERIFAGRYRLIRKLGSGGMAVVYLAEDQELGRRVAIKMLDERHARDADFVERFRREAKNAAGLSHPNIVAIYDRGEAEGTYYISMEYLEGKTLKELIVSRGPTPVAIAIDYTRQILAALAFAHKNGIVHRDIKPHNVVVAPDGRVKVMDFGIAHSGASQMTEPGSIIGTAQYLSPEQARGAPVDRRSDLYSVGVVLYEMLTGSVPFSGDTPLEIAMKHLSTTPTPPSDKRPEIPRDLDLVVLRALAKNPDDRFQSAEEMEADLARVAKGAGVSDATEEAATAVLSGTDVLAAAPTQIATARTRRAPPPAAGAGYRPPPVYEYAEPVRRRPWWPWLAALLLIVAAGFAGYYVYGKIRDELNQAKPVTVDDYRGIKQSLAVQRIRRKGLKPLVVHHSYDGPGVPVGYVYGQQPAPGEKTDKGNTVTIYVSTGEAKVEVPDVVGRSQTDAVAILTKAGLEANIHEVNSSQPPGTVTAQDPKGGDHVPKGSPVRINVSKGERPVPVPNEIGLPYDEAKADLESNGFNVAREDVDSSQPVGTVVSMSPGPNTEQPRGTTITLSVSKGPATSTVPDVIGNDEASARATLRDAGFRVAKNEVATTDVQQDGVVLNQDPPGGTEADPGTVVTIDVGVYVEPPPSTTITVPPEPTETVPTTTTGTTVPP